MQAYSQLLKTTESNSKIAMANQRLENVCRASLRVWGLIRLLKQEFGRSQELWMLCLWENSRKQYLVSKLKFFSSSFFPMFLLCYLCLYPVSFVFLLLFFIHTFDCHWNNKAANKAHIIKASNINNIITMTSWWNQDMTPYWIFRKII